MMDQERNGIGFKIRLPLGSPHTIVTLDSRRIFTRNFSIRSRGPSEQVTVFLTRQLAVALGNELVRSLRGSSSWKDMELTFEENS